MDYRPEPGEIVSNRNPVACVHHERTGRWYVTAFYADQPQETKSGGVTANCRLDRTPIRRLFRRMSWRVDGKDLSEFIPQEPELSGSTVLVRSDVAKRLEMSSFKGIRLDQTNPVDEDGNRVTLSHDVYQLVFLGKRCDEIKISSTVKKQCPFCGHGPMVCPDCRTWFYPECPRCGREYDGEVELDDGSVKYVNRLEGLFENNFDVLIGRDWDGSDAHGGAGDNPRYMSKRVLDLLLGMHAAPFKAVPVKIDVSGMTADQLALLETMKVSR